MQVLERDEAGGIVEEEEVVGFVVERLEAFTLRFFGVSWVVFGWLFGGFLVVFWWFFSGFFRD